MRPVLLIALITSVSIVGIRWGTFVAGGSDSYCYLHQAQRWASGRLQVPEPLALEAPWPNAPLTFAPVGHVPSGTVPGAIVPICAAGLSLFMAPAVAVAGERAAFLLIPVFGALLVAGAFVVASRYSRRIAVASALVVSSSPVFLYQLVQPMSDVPAAALWVLSVAAVTGARAKHAAWGGISAGAALLVRPNLLPLAAPLGLFLLLRPERTWRERIRASAIFAAGVLPGIVAVALIQHTLYGSALSSGYGSLDSLFRVERVAPNAVRYVTWLTETQTPVWVLAAAAPLLLPGALTRLLLALFLVNLVCYLPYVVFNDWSFLRFLLPTLPLLLILVVACIDSICRRLPARWMARPVVAAVAVVLAVIYVTKAEVRNVFRLRQLEARYERAGTFVARRLPPNAIVMTSSESGSVRFYSGRRTLTWDSLDPAWLDPSLRYLRGRGFEPYLLLETWEEPIFRRRFAATSSLGALDWPPFAEVASRVRIYRPDDRDKYLVGTSLPTEYAP
jgi:dolichyl-phosphate-mannose-protein mannosyltransferase